MVAYNLQTYHRNAFWIFNIQHCHYFTMQYYDITYYMVNEQLQNIFHELFHKDKRVLCGTRVYFELKIRYFVCVS